MICQARLRRLYVSELPGEQRTCLPVRQPFSYSPLPHSDGKVTAAGDGLEVSVADHCRMTTDDCASLKLPSKSKQKFEFYESNFKFKNKPNLKSLGLSEKKNAGLNCPRPLKCIQKIGKK